MTEQHTQAGSLGKVPELVCFGIWGCHRPAANPTPQSRQYSIVSRPSETSTSPMMQCKQCIRQRFPPWFRGGRADLARPMLRTLGAVVSFRQLGRSFVAPHSGTAAAWAICGNASALTCAAIHGFDTCTLPPRRCSARSVPIWDGRAQATRARLAPRCRRCTPTTLSL